MSGAAVRRGSASPHAECTLWQLFWCTHSAVAVVRSVMDGAEFRIEIDGELLTASLFREGAASDELATMAANARRTLERHGWTREP